MAAESGTIVNEELEDPCELWVFIDIEEVRENPYHLLLLGRQKSVPGTSGGRRTIWAGLIPGASGRKERCLGRPRPRGLTSLVSQQPSCTAPSSFTSALPLFFRPLASSPSSLLPARDPGDRPQQWCESYLCECLVLLLPLPPCLLQQLGPGPPSPQLLFCPETGWVL